MTLLTESRLHDLDPVREELAFGLKKNFFMVFKQIRPNPKYSHDDKKRIQNCV